MAGLCQSPPTLPPRAHARASSSSLLALVPSAVVTRITRVNSLRRSLSAYTLRPPPSPARRHLQRASGDWKADRPGSAGSEGPVDGAVLHAVQGKGLVSVAWDSRSAETWKFANQGLSLLSSALAETQLPPERASPAYARQLYVNGVAFLLRGLPSDLDSTEAAVLRASAPSVVVERADSESQSNQGKNSPPSLLHRGLAASIVCAFTLLALVLPLLELLVCRVIEHERKHRTGERAVGVVMDGMSAWVRWLVGFLCEALEEGDGKLMSALASSAIWCVEGIAGGIQSGVNEGLPLVKRREAGKGS